MKRQRRARRRNGIGRCGRTCVPPTAGPWLRWREAVPPGCRWRGFWGQWAVGAPPPPPATGLPLAGLEATVQLQHPTDRHADLALGLSEDTSGHFHGVAAPAAGQWDVLIDLSRGGERVFRSRNRIVLH